MKKGLLKAYAVFTMFVKVFMFSIFFFVTVSVVLNVFGRKIFGYSFNFLEELNRYILLICTLFGASIAVSRDSHPKMDAVQGLFRGRAKIIYQSIAKIIFTLFAGFVCVLGFEQLQAMIITNAMTATLKLPVYLFFASIPIGFLGMTVRAVFDTYFKIRELREIEILTDGPAGEGGNEP